MLKTRRATINDLATLARIHKIAYPRSHFSSLLPDKALMKYYGYFLGEGAEILLAEDDLVYYEPGAASIETAMGFAVFGFGIPEKIEIFKRECRFDILSVSFLNPFKAANKVLGALVSSLVNKRTSVPANFLLLSIAVVKPRCGVGRSLLNGMLELAIQKECKSVGLYVNVNNLSAINAYFSAGFIIMGMQGGQFYMEKQWR